MFGVIMTGQDYNVAPYDFWRKRRGLLSYSRLNSPKAKQEEAVVNRRRMEKAKKQAAALLRKSNAGKRKRHTVQEVIDFLESLPEQVTAEVEFAGSGLLRNEYTSGDELYSVSSVELRRIYVIKILGWQYFMYDEVGEWEFEHGIIFARDDEKRIAQIQLLRCVFDRYIDAPDYSSDGSITYKQLREAFALYECEHGDGSEPVFYRRSEDGPLYLREGMHPNEEEDAYFEDLEPLAVNEAIEQFWKSDWTVYEAYDHM